MFNASIRYEFDNGYQLDFMAGVRDEERKFGSDSDHGPINFIFAPGTESFFALSGIDEYEESSYEIRLSSPVDRAFSWTLGGFWYDYEQDVTDITFPGNTPDGTDNFIKNSAIFGSLSWQVNDRLRMTLEGRYADDEKEQEDYDALGALEFSGDDSFTSFAPRFTVDYGFDDNTLLYGIYSEGIKPGGLNGAAGAAVSAPQYGEEESRNFEFGIKKTFLDGRMQGNFALYFTDITQYQLTTPIAAPSGALSSVATNQGDGEVYGIEADIRGAVSENVEVGFTYALADSEFTKGCDDFQWELTSGGGVFTGDPAASANPNGQGDCSIAGHQFPMGSKHSASGYIDFNAPLGNGGLEVFGNLNVSFESKKYTQVHQEAYVGAATLVGARFGVGGENWTVSIVGRNLTEEDSAVLATRWLQIPYLSFASLNIAPEGASTSLPRAFFSLPRRDRQIGLELNYRFQPLPWPFSSCSLMGRASSFWSSKYDV